MKTMLTTLALATCLLCPAQAQDRSATRHRVVKGDSLIAIAKRYGVSLKELMRANSLEGSLIRPGQVLQLKVNSVATQPVPEQPGLKKISVNSSQAPALIFAEPLRNASAGSTSVVVDLSAQRAYLLVGKVVAIDTPVCTGKASTPTRLGNYQLTERVKQGKHSNRYDAALPYWMRLGNTAMGLHVGKLPGEPASHGCVRLPAAVAPLFFQHTVTGTRVQVLRSWTPPAAPKAELLAEANPKAGMKQG